MLKEIDLQSKIVDAVRGSDGHAFKCSNRFLIGVPDISMKLKAMPHAYNEVKLVKPWPKVSATVELELTEKQRKFLREYRKAGGIAMYTVFAHDGKQWLWHIGHDLTIKRLPRILFDTCPAWVEPKKMVAKFEAYFAEHFKI